MLTSPAVLYNGPMVRSGSWATLEAEACLNIAASENKDESGLGNLEDRLLMTSLLTSENAEIRKVVRGDSTFAYGPPRIFRTNRPLFTTTSSDSGLARLQPR